MAENIKKLEDFCERFDVEINDTKMAVLYLKGKKIDDEG